MIADAAAHDLRDDTDPEENEDHRSGELCGKFAGETRNLQACCHAEEAMKGVTARQ
ncbi:hypothetical protein GCM10010166_59870 [Couchioplanes caeruleus subsp. azureus]|nr:hypothetical protein GCM10010166_59870 [Couchioplanes caeruleus subsp. azureus]